MNARPAVDSGSAIISGTPESLPSRIGWLSAGAEPDPFLDGFREGLRKLGYVDGHNVVLEIRHAHGDLDTLRAGAAGYVLKRNAATELAAAIRAAHDGQAYLHPSIARRVIDDYLSRIHATDDAVSEPHERLTPREREVLQLAAEGHSTRAIAGLLCLSTKTVEHHRASVMTKLGLHGQTELVKYAIRAGLVESA